ncbi:MAG: ribonuclease J [Actinomycetia bacterium]|nr:ribonuclease J [Actinomycetes bacterium]MCH9799974.1 ribonuclease J [Actinomycetes bacterium]
MTVFEYDGRLLIVDCGVLFPEDEQPGVDLILPDFSYLEDRWQDIEALVLTHGHEDHIGAVPYLLRSRQDIPIYGSQLTLALLAAKLREHRIPGDLHEVAAGEQAEVGSFSLEFFAVTHSIPDALAVGIVVGGQRLVHTGDFKLDQLPLDGRVTDLPGLARLGSDGVDLLLVDSTNAEVPGYLTSERDIAEVLDRVFANARGRIIVASFASHIHRVQQVLDAAVVHDRRVAFVGRSMVRNMNVARDLGYLNVPGGTLVRSESLPDLPDDEAVLVCTGSQGEPMAVLSRIANRNHKIEVGEGDTVVLASSMIPGNENAVNRVINGLTQQGATVVHQGNARVHVSGHASAGELLTFYNIVRPRNVMPVHGEWRHLHANAALAQLTGVPWDNIVLAENGSVVDLVDGQVQITGQIPVGFVYVDGSSVGDITESQLKDRRILGDEGFISVFVVVDTNSGKVVAEPEIHERGFADDDDIFNEVRPLIKTALEDALAGKTKETRQLQQVVRRTVGQWVSRSHRRRPMILPVVVEV